MAGVNQLLVSSVDGRVQLARDYMARDVIQRDDQQPGEAEAAKDGLTLQQLNLFLEDMGQEPQWRKLADKCCDYYDNKQLDSELLQLMEERGVPPLISNMIHPTINAVLGMEAKNRRDWMVTYGDEGESEKVAKGINKKLNTAERSARADRAIGQAYAGQIKGGLGWVEVGRHANPMRDSTYRVTSVHRREIWWDWRNLEEEDWRYLVRKKWFDEDHLIEAMPHFKSLIQGACRGWPTHSAFADIVAQYNNGSSITGLSDQAEVNERTFSVSEHEWRDISRRRAVMFEVWYRKWKRGLVCRLPNNRVIEFDQKNPRHLAGFQAGIMSPFPAIFPQVRQSIWIGPHRLFDRKTPHPHNHFPYVPFFGFREDTTQIPYGLIRTMISPQDEINARRSRIQALSGSRRAEIDNDALDTAYNTIEDALDEVSRHDSALILNKDRKNGIHAVRITDNGDLTVAQFQMLQESKQEIHQSSGLFPSMLGDETGAKSGIAINSLVEQSTTTLGEINDEYGDARRRVGELFLSLIVEDSHHPHSVSLGEGKAKTQIYFNRPMGQNEVGDEVKENDVSLANLKLELEDVPSTQTYKQQQFAQLAEITKALPPEVQQFVIDFVIEATDNPDRHKMAKRIRSHLGIPEEGVDGEEDPAMAQMKQQYEAKLQEQGAMLQEAMDAAKKLELANADKTDQNAIKSKEADYSAKCEEDKLALERDRLAFEREQAAREEEARFMESIHAAAGEAPEQVAEKQAQQQADEQAKQELAATIKELRALVADVSKEGQARVRELEKKLVDQVADAKREMLDRELAEKEKTVKEREKSAAAPKPVAAPTAPSVVFEKGAINIGTGEHEEPAPVEPPKPVSKTVTLNMPDGRVVTGTITPEGVTMKMGDGRVVKGKISPNKE